MKQKGICLACHKNGSEDYERAKALRQDSPFAEKLLWDALRLVGKGMGVQFRRQQPIHPYIVDFACMRAKIVIEVDGVSHDVRQEADHRRDAFLLRCGYDVRRFSDKDVLENARGVAETIVQEIIESEKWRESDPSPNPSRKGRGARKEED